MDRRGFTLLELALVLAVIGTLLALAVPGYQYLVSRTRVAEARSVLEAIAHAELGYYRDHGSYLACSPSPAEVPRGRQGRFDKNAAGWRQLGLHLEGPLWYRYHVELGTEGSSFVAVATGDLDADGEEAQITLDGATMTFVAQNELE